MRVVESTPPIVECICVVSSVVSSPALDKGGDIIIDTAIGM